MKSIIIGDTWIDKEWEDDIIKITAINNKKTSVRYKFIQIKGETLNENIFITWSLNINTLKDIYKPYNIK